MIAWFISGLTWEGYLRKTRRDIAIVTRTIRELVDSGTTHPASDRRIG